METTTPPGATPDIAVIRERLRSANEALSAISPYPLDVFDPAKIRLLEKNARFMKNDTFAQLVANVSKDGGLQSLPFVWREPGQDPEKPLVLSGNHRIMAARQAELTHVLCLVIEGALGDGVGTAIQLAHNAIAGQDDPQTLKDLYQSVEDLNLKAYSGLDEATLKQLSQIKFVPISEPRIKFREVPFLFLPPEVDEIKELLVACGRKLEEKIEDPEGYLFLMRDYQEFFTILASAKEALNIRNSAATLLAVLRAGRTKIEQDAAREAVRDEGPST